MLLHPTTMCQKQPNYRRNVPVIFRLVEILLVSIAFLLSRYGGLVHVGADPPLKSAQDLQNVGHIPCTVDR